MRVVFDGVDDLVQLMPDLTPDERTNVEFGSYSAQQYFDDMARVTQYRADPDLVDLLVRESFPTLVWMAAQGIRFQPSYGRQAFKVDGRFRFWGGLAVEAWGGGPGLVEGEHKVCRDVGVDLRYETPVVGLLVDDARCGAGRAGPPRGSGARRRRPGGGPRRRRVRVERRVAGPLPRPELGPGEGPGHPLQHGRRHPHGARGRGATARPLVGLPRRGLGPELTPLRRPGRGRRLPEALLSRSASW